MKCSIPSPQSTRFEALFPAGVCTRCSCCVAPGTARSELLCLPADVIKSGFDRNLQKERFWIAVRYNEYEDDPRYSTPRIKNAKLYQAASR